MSKTMATTKQSENKLLNIKNSFDYITSENATNWKLVLFWIVIVELLATMFEYTFIGHPTFNIDTVNNTLTGQFIVGMTLTAFIWSCVYNFIFWNRTNFLYLILFGTLGLYLTVTHDLYFDFLISNINPIHLFSIGFSFAILIELIFKLIITYLIYQLVISLKVKKTKNITP